MRSRKSDFCGAAEPGRGSRRSIRFGHPFGACRAKWLKVTGCRFCDIVGLLSDRRGAKSQRGSYCLLALADIAGSAMPQRLLDVKSVNKGHTKILSACLPSHRSQQPGVVMTEILMHDLAETSSSLRLDKVIDDLGK